MQLSHELAVDYPLKTEQPAGKLFVWPAPQQTLAGTKARKKGHTSRYFTAKQSRTITLQQRHNLCLQSSFARVSTSLIIPGACAALLPPSPPVLSGLTQLLYTPPPEPEYRPAVKVSTRDTPPPNAPAPMPVCLGPDSASAMQKTDMSSPLSHYPS
jgi:hypothetical protein